jgi:hypothetical protein
MFSNFLIFRKKIYLNQIVYNRRYMTRSGIFGGVVFGFATGTLLGLLRSTEYVLKRFESLGPEYYLGRIAIQEISDYRMDVKIRKSA